MFFLRWHGGDGGWGNWLGEGQVWVLGIRRTDRGMGGCGMADWLGEGQAWSFEVPPASRGMGTGSKRDSFGGSRYPAVWRMCSTFSFSNTPY